MSSRRMQSCLYECRVMHHRFAPKEHRFLYRIFLFAIDLDELDTLPARLALFSVNRAGLYSFRENDYLPTHEKLHQPEAPHVICGVSFCARRALKALGRFAVYRRIARPAK